MNNKQKPAETSSRPSFDILVECLLFVCRHHGKPASAATLTAGLPLTGGRLTAPLTVRAARRAGLEARIVDRKLSDLGAAVFPVIAMLQKGYAIVITGQNSDGSYQVFDPGHEKQRIVIPAGQLDPHYAGQIIMLRPAAAHELERDVSATGQDWFWGTLRQFRPLYRNVAIASIFINMFALVSSLFIMNVYDRVIPNSATATLWVLAIGAIIAYLFDVTLRMLRDYFVDVAGRGADLLLSAQLFQQVMNIKLGQRNTSAGALANQLRDFEGLREFFTSATIMAIVDVPFVLLFVIVIALIGGPVLAVIPLLAIPVMLFVGFAVQMPLVKMVQLVANELDAKHGHLVEAVTGLEVVKTAGAQNFLQSKWEHLTGVAARLGMKTKFLASLGMNITTFIQQVITVVLVIVGVYLIKDAQITTGALVAATILTGRTMAPIASAMNLFIRYQQSKHALGNLNMLMASDVEHKYGQAYVSLENYKGGVRFKDVTFKYPGSPMPSLRDVNLTIQPGEKVGIIGRVGCGKSTLARLIMQLYEPENGSIFFDGLESRQLDPAEIRQHVGYVPQQLTLFRGTLRENIMMTKPDATNNQLITAAEIAGVYDMAQRHPFGFEMPVGERGETLSGGQRQAVTIARALLPNPKVLIMDEPTSEMDNRSEELLMQGINEWLTRDKTLILITHRASTLKLVDRIIVIDGARVVLDGPKDKVLAQLQKGITAPARS